MGVLKRKLIDLEEHTFNVLSATAAKKGTNLKVFIEKSLDKIAEDVEDIEVYEYLLKNFPEGKKIISDKDKEEFENWLGL